MKNLITCLVVSVLSCLICSAVSADTPVMYEDFELHASDGASYDGFGYSVAISGDTLVVGAYGDDDNGAWSGSAYVYRFDGTDWIETKLLASDGASYDYFGRSVAISGDTVVVGAYGDDDNGDDSGSAYVYRFDGSSWVETKLLASDGASGDQFGVSVAVDGDTVVVGARYDDDNGSDSGSAYVYRFDGSSWVETKLLASDGAFNDFFGFSVAISGDTVVVGASHDDDNGDDSGSAYVYRFDGTDWIETKLLASDGAELDYFGDSVAVDGDTVVVGAYRDDDNGYDSGSAYVYRFDGSSWIETKLLASDGASGDNFGLSVAINGDTVVVGARLDDDNGDDSGSAYIFYVGEPVDTDGDGVDDSIDNCYLYNPDQADCNDNGIGDVCDIDDQTSYDCDQNGVPDECQPDCDGDGWIDACDNEGDCDDDGIPDNCELDCNENSIPDECDIIFGFSQDCNENSIPDECDIAEGIEQDCNDNGIPDSCEFIDGTASDCNNNNIPDFCDINDGTEEDCNANGIPDTCDIADGNSNDVNENDIPDECEQDCNRNGLPDHWDIKKGTSEDCNANGVPDECDIDEGTSTDWNGNGIPDDCEVDCNTNGYPDDYDIKMGWSDDVNGDGIPDECQCIADITDDNMVDVEDLLAIIGYWGSDGPLGDVNEDGIVDVSDMLIVIGNWGPCE